MITARFLTLAAACFATCRAYTLVQTYDSTNFMDEFTFFTATDPTDGYVIYDSEEQAEDDYLLSTDGYQVYLGVDWTNVASTGGRQSVRVTSNEAFTQGLIIADIEHMPVGCGAWPSFWTLGPDWPANGEIDIIEGVNNATTNQMSLHTALGCTVDNSGSLEGTVTSNGDCHADTVGCGVSVTNQVTFGNGFNDVAGGVYATQWTSAGIYIWFFQRNAIPADITSGYPDPTGWGTPLVAWQDTIGTDSCDFATSFQSNQLVFDTTFCGVFGDDTWDSSTCAAEAGGLTCAEYVANVPGAFKDAYWLINTVSIYQ